jgi:hypothetical protein
MREQGGIGQPMVSVAGCWDAVKHRNLYGEAHVHDWRDDNDGLGKNALPGGPHERGQRLPGGHAVACGARW